MHNGGVSFWWDQIGIPSARPALGGDLDVTPCFACRRDFGADALARVHRATGTATRDKCACNLGFAGEIP
jgi:hypothetical protein